MPYLFEMHFHTSETSECGSIPAETGVNELRKAGYDGVVVTDHYCGSFFEHNSGGRWEESIGLWLAGYRAAKKAAENTEFVVLLGAEIRFSDTPNDFLVYGFEESFLIEHPHLYRMTPAEFKPLADKNGLFFAQAHPFRDYCSRCNPEYLHGIEVHNGNQRHGNFNELAFQFAEENGKIMLSGSDMHEYEDIGQGGIYFDVLPKTEKELVQCLYGEHTLKV